MTDFSVGTTITNDFIEPINATNPSKTGLVFGGRTLPANNLLVPPLSNTPMPPLYVPFELPAYTTGLQALAALKQMGFQYTLGTAFSATFEAPNAVSANPVSGLTTLTWNDPLMGIQYLVGQDPVGSAVQNTSTANGTIVSVSIVGNQSFMVISPNSGSAAYVTGDTIVITAELADPMPDPSTSDEICVAAYAFYNQYGTSAIFNTSPNLWCSVYITGRDTSISATATSIPLVAPTSAVVQPDNSVNLTYAITAQQLGLIPSTYLGASIITQATSAATGTLNGYTLTSTTCVINVINVTGTFDTSHTVSVVLDNTQSGFNYLGNNQINSFGIGYNISNLSGLSTTHADFYNNIVALQAPNASESNKFNVQGYYSYVAASINAIALNLLTTPNNTFFVATAKTDVPTAVQYPANAMMTTMCSMFDDLNNEYPYNGTDGQTATLALTASTNSAALPPQSTLNQLCTQGWKALGINSSGQIYIYRNVCTLQSIGGVVDNSYRFEDIQLKTRYLDENFYAIAEATAIDPQTGMRLNNNPELITNMKNNLSSFLNTAYANGAGIVGNTNNSVSVTINPNATSRLIINITTTISPANSGSDIVVYVTQFSI